MTIRIEYIKQRTAWCDIIHELPQCFTFIQHQMFFESVWYGQRKMNYYIGVQTNFPWKWTLSFRTMIFFLSKTKYLILNAVVLLEQISAESWLMKNCVVFKWVRLWFTISVQGSFCSCSAVNSNWISLRKRSNGCRIFACNLRARLPNVDIRDDVVDSWI